MSIEGLKEQARRHEQKEEWKKALELYQRAIDRLAEEEQPDVALYNRVGDLCVRVGELERATQHYERAVDLYVEAELPNNAIAVCKKIIRNVPAREAVFLRMGRIRAEQGFLTDARQNFLTYAEKVQAAGKMDEALRALEELANLFPGDAEIHLSLARQLQQHGRKSEAVQQLQAAYAAAAEFGDSEKAEAIEARAREIDPSVDFAAARASEPPSSPALDADAGGAFELGSSMGLDSSDSALGAGDAPRVADEDAHPEERAASTSGLGDDPAARPLEEMEGLWPSFSIAGEGETEVVDESEESERAEPLPSVLVPESDPQEADAMFAIGASELEIPGAADENDEHGAPLPLLHWTDEGEEAPALPLLGGDEARTADQIAGLRVRDALERVAEEALPEQRRGGSTPEELIAAGDLSGAERLIRDLMEREPTETSHRQRLIEVAYRRGDVKAQAAAYVELARCLERGGNAPHAEGVYQMALQLDPENASARAALPTSARPVTTEVAPVASSEDYVDLGSLIFGEEEEKTTRFLVEYEAPTGDEQADFARMLSQFKTKIAQNVAADDVRAHHDLGMAYKEMGLIEEAIEEFQAALRASRDHLPTYELLGQCFIEKGQPEAAVRALQRALGLGVDVEDELLGIYYFLGRAYEQTGNKESAVEYYDRVFSLDINFMDVTERLRALR